MANKLINHFCVVGLKELKPLDPEEDEGMIWLKVTYMKFEEAIEDKPIITSINFFWMPSGGEKTLLIPTKDDWCPVPIRDLSTNTLEHRLENISSRYAAYIGNYDLARLINMDTKQGHQLVLCYRAALKPRDLPLTALKPRDLPLTNIKIEISQSYNHEPGSRRSVVFNLQPNYRILQLVLGKHKNRALCWKVRKDPLLRAYAPEHIDLYPRSSGGEDFEIPSAVPMFCFPDGIRLSREQFTPTSFSFVLTEQSGERIYGTCLCFYEQAKSDIIKKLHGVEVSDTKKLYTPKSICLVSMWPFVDKFKELLKQIYRIHISSQTLPLERVICNLIDEVPLPGPGDYAVHYDIGNTTIEFNRPSLSRPSYIHLESMEILFRTLSVDNVALLSHIALAITALMFPFKWLSVLIPILPKTLRAYIGAPVPYIIGIPPEFLTGEQSDFPSETALVYLDENRIVNLDPLPPLPSKYSKVLKSRLEVSGRLWRPHDSHIETIDEAFNIQIHDDEDEGENPYDPFDIMDAFFQFMLGKNYHKYLTEPLEIDKSGQKKKVVLNDARDAFKTAAYLKSQESNKIGSFLYKLLETGHFARFIESRLYLEPDADLRYFDECMKQKKPKKGQFIYYEESKSVITAISPNTAGIAEDAIFKYDTFPVLDETHFVESRKEVTEIQPTQGKGHGKIYLLPMAHKSFDKMSNGEWARHLLGTIYRMWFAMYSLNIADYGEHSADLMNYALYLLDIMKKKTFKPDEATYSRLIEACGRCKIVEYGILLFRKMKDQGIEPSPSIYGIYVQAVGSGPNVGHHDSQ
eukprot:CAMPEP_0115038160 /NCGR_PEP_ID=MMETSP0216-20121206/43241_1 /TAXON_ID=223996 /ORGANISM="Protocruzia adherens, Strain Boccale" /LENGTH=803 /DNA_ID=CAMNT_0002418503 /DNA_START=60 /DNA_END=2468 /DNA_ORIENTATION=+